MRAASALLTGSLLLLVTIAPSSQAGHIITLPVNTGQHVCSPSLESVEGSRVCVKNESVYLDECRGLCAIAYNSLAPILPLST